MNKKLLQLYPDLISSERITPFRSAPKQAHPKSTLFKLSLLPLLLFALLTFAMGNEVKGQTNPSLHDLSTGSYTFTSWPAASAAGTYPANMRFWEHSKNDPGLSDLEDTDYTAAYNLTSGRRILGDGSDGFSFLNVGTANNHLGAAVVGLNTTGIDDVVVSWTGKTVATGARDYRIRLQYRIGSAGAWIDVPGPIEYVHNSTVGNTQEFTLVELPAAFGNKSEVYLKWKYYQAAGSPGGTRPRLGITEITVQEAPEDPIIIRNPATLSDFLYGEGNGPSAEQFFTVSGSNLDANIVITPPANFEISETSNAGFTTDDIILTQVAGAVALTTIYVRLAAGLDIDTYSGNINITSAGAPSQTVELSGEVVEPIFLIYEFTGNSVAPTQSPANATTSNFLVSAGTIVFGTANDTDWSGSGVPYAQSNTGWTTASADGAKNFNFSITPDLGYGVNLSNISFQYRRTPAGPNNITVEINGIVVANVSNFNANSVFTFDQELSDLTNLNSVEVRIKGWVDGPTGGGEFRINDVRLDGEMVEDIYFATITERSGEGWRVLTSPVPGTSLATLLDPIWTQGPAGSDDPNTPDGNENILFLNTTTNQYEAPADMDREIADGEGFAVYVFARDDYEDENSVTWPKILSVPGQPRTSDLSLDNARLANAAGQFTLLGNPFAETISIGNFSAFSLNNIAQVFYVYDHDFRPDSFTAPDLPGDEPPAGPGGGFRAWNGTTGGLTDGLIAAFQGFYVETTGASPTLTIPASAVTTGGTLFGTPDSETFAFEIAARINQRQSGMTFFSFGEDGSLSFNQRDARMLYPLDFSPFLAIYSEADGQTTHIKHLPSELAEAVVLPLHIEAWQPNAGFTAYEPIQGSVEMVWPDVSNLPAAWTVTLTDTFTGVVLNLRETDRYDFVTGDVERSAGRTLTHELALRRVPATERAGTRFLLTIDPEMPTSAPVTGELPRALALSQNYPNPFNPTTMIRFEMPAAEEVRLEVYNVQGQRVAVLVNGTVQAGVHNVSFDASALSSGVYLYRLQAGNQVLTRKMTLIK